MDGENTSPEKLTSEPKKEVPYIRDVIRIA
jgi:hypothetical protein